MQNPTIRRTVNTGKKPNNLLLKACVIGTSLAIAGTSVSLVQSNRNKMVTNTVQEEVQKQVTTYLTAGYLSDGTGVYESGEIGRPGGILDETQISNISAAAAEMVTQEIISDLKSPEKISPVVTGLEDSIHDLITTQYTYENLSEEDRQNIIGGVKAIVEATVADNINNTDVSKALSQAAQDNIEEIKARESENAKAIATLSQQVSGNADKIAALGSATNSSQEVAELKTEIAALTSKLQNLSSEYQSLQNKYDSANSSIKALQKTAGGYATTESVDNVNSTLSEVSQTVTGLNSSLQTQVAGIYTKLASIESDSSNSAEVAALKQELTALQTELDNASNQISQMATRASVEELSDTFNAYIANADINTGALNARVRSLESIIGEVSSLQDFSLMYNDYMSLIRTYSSNAESLLTLTEIASKMASQEDFDRLNAYAIQLKSDMDANVESLQSQITNQIANVQSQIDANTADIEDNAELIAANTARIAELEATAAALETDAQYAIDLAENTFEQIFGISYDPTVTDAADNIIENAYEQIGTSNTVYTDEQSLSGALYGAIAAYQEADQAILTALESEASARDTAITNLNASLTASLTTEATARANKDQELSERIDEVEAEFDAKFMILTQSEYDALKAGGTINNSTIYFIAE